MTAAVRLPLSAVQSAQRALDTLAAPLPGMRAALVTTPDGFELASLPCNDIDMGRLAAMTSALMAMARAVGSELAYPPCRRLVFDTPHGSVVMQPVGAKVPCHVCLVLGPEALLGGALWTLGQIEIALRAME